MSLSTLTHGTGDPIVVLPGLGLDAGFAAALMEPAFADRPSRRRIYVSLPGAGSPPMCAPSSDAILDVLTDEIPTWLDGGRFRLIGHSYGGYLAAALAARFPGQVDGTLLVCAGVKMRPSDRDLTRVLSSTPEAGWLDGCPESLHEHLRQAVGRQQRDVADRLAAAFAAMSPADDDFVTELQERYQLSAEQPWSERRPPVTFAVGRSDRVVGFRDQLAAAFACRSADYVAYSAAGHYLPAEVPAEFAALVSGWLRRPGRGGNPR